MSSYKAEGGGHDPTETLVREFSLSCSSEYSRCSLLGGERGYYLSTSVTCQPHQEGS